MTIFRNRRAERAEALLEDTKNELFQMIDEIRSENWASGNRLIDAHREHVRAMELLHAVIEGDAMRERIETKNAHAAELNRVIEENQRLKDDLDRFRLLLTPALQSVELPKEREVREAATPEPREEVITGTPFQRMAKKFLAEQEKAASKRYVKPADAPLAQGESHGVSSEGRVDAPLGGASKPA